MVKASKGGAHKKDPDYGFIRIFVYGTLKKSQPNNIVLRKSGAHFLGYDSVTIASAAFLDLGGFPAIVWPIDNSQQSSQVVRGEVWYGGPEIMKSCDILEGHPLFYNRRKHWSDLLKRRVWVYTLEESWISESEDFMTELSWKPSEMENKFWDTIQGAA